LWVESCGSGAAVVLLHGAGMDGRLWDAVFPDLAGDHRAIRYDARGLGRSPTPERPYHDVADLAAVLDHAGVERAALVGLSMGGETVLDFALEHPERVTALTLVGPSVSGYNWPDTPELAAYAAARRDGDADALAELELSIWAPLGTAAPGGDLVAAMVADNATRRIVAERLARYPDTPAITRLGDVAAPTLVVHGDRDHPEIASIADLLVARIPGAAGELVPDADHYLPLRAPRRLATLLRAHLKAAVG
jgi:pimeloyl-ACP methyl ester carboxylesterase